MLNLRVGEVAECKALPSSVCGRQIRGTRRA